ncbi:hypothetical protein C8R44DRAFT_747684 [Mycena epipterygia]|nr:hypothetical protein C8R44DRAFT_747684 [Mycena epipterygia]
MCLPSYRFPTDLNSNFDGASISLQYPAKLVAQGASRSLLKPSSSGSAQLSTSHEIRTNWITRPLLSTKPPPTVIAPSVSVSATLDVWGTQIPELNLGGAVKAGDHISFKVWQTKGAGDVVKDAGWLFDLKSVRPHLGRRRAEGRIRSSMTLAVLFS